MKGEQPTQHSDEWPGTGDHTGDLPGSVTDVVTVPYDLHYDA